MALSRNEIQALQRKNKLTPDGIVGPRTQNVIDTEIFARQIAKQDDLLVNLKKSIERAMDIEVEKKKDKTRLEKFAEFFENRWDNKPSNDIVMDPESYRLFTTPGALDTMPSRYEGKRVSYNANLPKKDTAYLVNDGVAETLYVAGRRLGKTEMNTQILEALLKTASDADLKRYLSGELKLDIRGPISNPDGLRGIRANQLIVDEYANVDPRAYQYLIRPSTTDTIMTSPPSVSEEAVANFMEAFSRANEGALIVPKGVDVEIIQAVYVDPCEPYSLVDFIEEG